MVLPFLLFVFMVPDSLAFIPLTTTITSSSVSSSFILHCICIDCKWVTNCRAYHFVETKHEQPHLNEHPTFLPRDGSPTIHVNIRPAKNTMVDSSEGNQFRKESTLQDTPSVMEQLLLQQLEQTPQEEAKDRRLGISSSSSFSTTTTTYEYDVVACADFVLDQGCWVRNMPEEIRRANPHFVPT
jgi:hypothetical protein